MAQRRTVAGKAAFGIVRRAVGGAAIPLAMRSGPLERPALRLYRAAPRPAFMRGLGGAAIPNPVEADGLRLFGDERPSITLRELALGAYERKTAAYVEDALQPGGRFLDIGAHIGYFTLLAARAVRESGHVTAFEPEPGNRALLERNIAENGYAGRVDVAPLAVGGAPGLLSFHRDAADTGSGGLFRRDSGHGGSPFEVEVTTVDRWAESAGWPQVDLVKMDIEGAEVDALRGMREFRARCPQAALIVEVNEEALAAAGQDTKALFQAVLALGYRKLTPLRPEAKPLRTWRQALRLGRDSWWRPPNLLCE